MTPLVAFWSPSGSGATTLLLNVAAALGAKEHNIVAVDLNLTAPSLALYADLLLHQNPASACLSRLLPALLGGRPIADLLAAQMVQGPGFRVLPGMLDVTATAHLTEVYVRQILLSVREQADLLLVDTSAPLDSVGCLPVMEMADLIVLIAGADLISRFHTRRHILTLLEMGWSPKVALVINQAPSSFSIQASEEMGLPVAAVIPALKGMDHRSIVGQIAYRRKLPTREAYRFKTAIDLLADLIARREYLAQH